MKSFKTELGNKGSSCLTIIKESGYFVCEVCKNSKNDIRYSVILGKYKHAVASHFSCDKHKEGLAKLGLAENNLIPDYLIFPDAENAVQYYHSCKDRSGRTNEERIHDIFGDSPDYPSHGNENEDNPQHHYENILDHNNPYYGDQGGSSHNPNEDDED